MGRIVWTDDEWDRLADRMWRMTDPALTWRQKWTRAMDQVPESRRRLPPAKMPPDLDQRLRSIRADLEKRAGTAVTKAQVLASLSEDDLQDILQRVPDRLYLPPLSLYSDDELIAELRRRLDEEQPDRPVIQTPITPQTRRKPKVVITGGTDKQRQQVVSRLPDYRVVFDPTPGGDWYIVWANFTGHSESARMLRLSPPGRFLVHHGGIKGLVELVQSLGSLKI